MQNGWDGAWASRQGPKFCSLVSQSRVRQANLGFEAREVEAPEFDARRQSTGFAHRIEEWATLNKSLTNSISSVI